MRHTDEMMGFRADPKTARLVEAERQRLEAQASGTPVTKAQAIRSLICKTSTVAERPDA